MLGGNHHCMDLQGLHRAIFFLAILNCHLSFSIRAQPPQFAVLAHICQLLAQACCHGVCQWHAIFSLITGIAKHDTLITSTNIHIIFTNVNTAGNVWALLVDANYNLTSLVTQALAVNTGQVVYEGVKANLFHNTTDNLLIVKLGLSCDLARNHDHVVLSGSFTGHFAFGIFSQASIQNSIRHLITELIWMTFVDRLRRKEEDAFRLGLLHRWLCHGC
mmetsp:Transcript_151451/g.278205  ORF Transcript_151451/g.278205 Transcript_151451/m.278205 type:complete len:218 (-) Transcript_151451:81-734(-)